MGFSTGSEERGRTGNKRFCSTAMGMGITTLIGPRVIPLLDLCFTRHTYLSMLSTVSRDNIK